MPAHAAALEFVKGSWSPANSAFPGEVVDAGITLYYTIDSGQEFMECRTDLSDAKWDIAILRDGIPQVLAPSSGRSKYLSGFILYYPNSHDMRLVINLTGQAPSQSTIPGGFVLLAVDYVSSDGEWVRDSYMQNLSLSSALVPTAIETTPTSKVTLSQSGEFVSESGDYQGLLEDLSRLRCAIDAASQEGADLSMAEESYADADDALFAARYEDAAQASVSCEEARVALNEGFSRVIEARSSAFFSRAELRIADLDELILRLRNDSEYADHPSLWGMESHRDAAAALLLLGKESMQDNNLTAAGDYADGAYQKADEACLIGLALLGESPSGETTPGIAGILDSGSGDLNDILHQEITAESALSLLGTLKDLLFDAADGINSLLSQK